MALPFAAASIPTLASSYSSSQVGSDGFPVGPVTAEFVQDRGSKLPLLYPGSVVSGTRATGESKTLNRHRMASWEETLGKNGPSADVQAWYERTLVDGGWQEISCQPGFQNAVVMVFVRGSRETVRVLVTGDGVGGIVIDYQITPSAEPLRPYQTASQLPCASPH